MSRIVPNLSVEQTAAAAQFYRDVLGLQPVMDLDWIVTLADPQRPGSQLSLITHDATGPVNPVVSLQVDDVDAAYAAAAAAGAEVVHPLTDEEWGVRRFFFRDPAGHVVNVLGHPSPDGLALVIGPIRPRSGQKCLVGPEFRRFGPNGSPALGQRAVASLIASLVVRTT